ncbi:protein of unknown function [Candidatus Methylopumilus planktonicus]|uniref:Uncharacterized protein n=1 Tax=Candidatus Methylopumilus planktonicus TaxID=1581557 RepID=A0A0D6EUN6_9PROT|nr:protein of unknown function [Candidatus Methylopumilus planktonicus]
MKSTRILSNEMDLRQSNLKFSTLKVASTIDFLEIYAYTFFVTLV